MVLNHTMQVFDNCKHIINYLNKEQRGYLDKKITENKIKNLFLLSVLFHDIGKIKTIKSKNDKTMCINHEKISSRLLLKTQINKLSKIEFDYVKSIIKNHDLIQISLDRKNYFEKKYSELKKDYPNIILELTILGIADIYKGDLRKNNYDEYEYRIKKLSNKLKVLLL